MSNASLHTFLAGPLPKGVPVILDRLCQTEGVRHIAVMPDVHLASEFCVGTVVASDEFLFPNAVGGDIGCGMLAMQFDGNAGLLEDPERAARLLGALSELCPPRRHHRRLAPTLPPEICELRLSDDYLSSQANAENTRMQLGTLGAGNHFLEFQYDDEHQLWLMLHTGSRHLGQTIHHFHIAQTVRLTTGITALPAHSPSGQRYYQDVQAGRVWAKENRRQLAVAAARAVEQALGVMPHMETLFDCDHNHLQRETHFGQELFIHRKGATAAREGERGLIPGSMATRSFHTIGRGNGNSLYSSSHGAGRLLSRAEARAQISRRQLREELTRARLWYAPQIEDALREESPNAYKPIDAVMRAQNELTTIIKKLRPLLIHKGC